MSIFVDIDPGTIVPQLVQDFEDYLGVVLSAGDQRREFLQGFGYALTTALQTIEATGEKELLETSFGQYLDKLGALVGVERRPAAAATCTVQFTLSNAQPHSVTIPQGTRVTPDGNLFFATTEVLIIASGQTSGTVLCEATEPGAQYNGYLPGQISQLVDGVSYVATVSNTTESGGGADVEDDDSYRERIRMAPLAFSAAGPSGAYDPVLQAVLDACDDKTRRPLTDSVQVLPAVASNTTISAQYWISAADQAKASSIQAAVTQAVDDYKAWQTEQIGRAINPDELRKRMLNAGASRITLTAPVYTELDANEVAQFTSTSVTYQGVG